MSYQELGRGRQALGSVSVLFFLNKQGSDRSPCFLLIIEIGHLSGLLMLHSLAGSKASLLQTVLEMTQCHKQLPGETNSTSPRFPGVGRA